MRKNDARKLDHKTLEELRMRVVKRAQDGESPEVLAKALDLDRSTVYGWLARYRQGGWNGLKAKPLGGTGSSEAVTRPRLPQNVACGVTALRSSAVDSQHRERLQLPVRSRRFGRSRFAAI